MKKQAALIIGAVVAGLSAVGVLLSSGGLDDGLQLYEVIAIGSPVLAALGIRTQVWSQESADLLAPREKQDAVRHRR